MNLFVQIPCFNEEKTLPVTLNDLPRKLDGIDRVYWLVIDDGSSDKTIDIAKNHDVDFIVSHSSNLGLAKAFQTGLEACTMLGADIIVNTDADNQYNAHDIQKIIDPILEGKAEYVVGARPIDEIEHFSPLKKYLQKKGSQFVQRLSKLHIPDTTSGFRAISKKAARKLQVFNTYTYTLETLIQAGQLKIPTISVDIRVNENLRESRLISSIFDYLKKSSTTIFRSFLAYNPLKTFLISGLIPIIIAILLGIRYLFFYFQGAGAGHVQSLLLAVILFILGTSAIMLGLIADLISVNRKILEDISNRVRIMESSIENSIDNGSLSLTHGTLIYKKKKKRA